MKILLASLMCLVLGASQCFALKGGPWGRGGGRVTVTGTYAGVFLPPLTPDLPPTEADNSLALFTVTVPSTGLGSGIVAIFRNGNYYSGTMVATADPDSARLFANVSAAFSKLFTSTFSDVVQEGEPPPPHDFGGDCTATTQRTLFTNGTAIITTTLTCTFNYTANGTISDLHGVRISPNPNVFSTSTARLQGSAQLDYRTDDPNAAADDTATVTYSVIGFKQAEITQ
jgi:hypothetical protein